MENEYVGSLVKKLLEFKHGDSRTLKAAQGPS